MKSIATKLSVKTIRNEFIVNVTSLFRGSTVTVKSLSLQGPQSQSWQRGENSPAENIILRPCHFREHPSCVQSNKQPLSTIIKWQIKSCKLFIIYTEQWRTRSPLWAAGRAQTCCSQSSPSRQTPGASWNWRPWCGSSTWREARRDL